MELIAHVEFTDGVLRPIFEDDGRQYVTNVDGNRMDGMSFIPCDAGDLPFVVDTGDDEIPF